MDDDPDWVRKLARTRQASKKAARRRAAFVAATGGGPEAQPLCPCGKPRQGAGAYCRACRAAYMREYRRKPRKHFPGNIDGDPPGD